VAGGWIWARGLAAGLDVVTPIAESTRLTLDVEELSQLPPDVQSAYLQQDKTAGPGDLAFVFGKKHGDFFTLRADLHFSIVLLLSLFWATLVNVPPLRRLAILTGALALLYVFQLVQAELYAQLTYASGRAGEALALVFTDGQRYVLDKAASLAKIGERGFPVLLWIGCFLATRPAPPDEPGPQAPTPAPASESVA
jgi:hypothetical protein